MESGDPIPDQAVNAFGHQPSEISEIAPKGKVRQRVREMADVQATHSPFEPVMNCYDQV
jgi:hypothetical protein